MATTEPRVDLVQGEDDRGRKFGYVHGEDGGLFFTWNNTLDATIASIEEDEVDGDGDLDIDETAAFLRDYLPTTKRGRKMWGNDPAD